MPIHAADSEFAHKRDQVLAEIAERDALDAKVQAVIKREPGLVTPERFAELAAELGLTEDDGK